jgi:ketosteroid isomerase-like protein
MRSSSGTGVVLAAIAVIVALLLLVGGVGFYGVTARRQAMVVAQAEKVRAHEVRARMMAEEARAQAADELERLQGTAAQASAPEQIAAIRAAVEAVLRAQEDAWNRGDIDAFMEHYWKSDDLTFSSGGKTTRGWNATLARYRDRYPTRDQMGRLSLSGLEITPLGDSAALVLGHWKLDRETEPVSGNFTLVVRKFDDHWLIVHDHTSRLTD